MTCGAREILLSGEFESQQPTTSAMTGYVKTLFTCADRGKRARVEKQHTTTGALIPLGSMRWRVYRTGPSAEWDRLDRRRIFA